MNFLLTMSKYSDNFVSTFDLGSMPTPSWFHDKKFNPQSCVTYVGDGKNISPLTRAKIFFPNPKQIQVPGTMLKCFFCTFSYLTGLSFDVIFEHVIFKEIFAHMENKLGMVDIMDDHVLKLILLLLDDYDVSLHIYANYHITYIIPPNSKYVNVWHITLENEHYSPCVDGNKYYEPCTITSEFVMSTVKKYINDKSTLKIIEDQECVTWICSKQNINSICLYECPCCGQTNTFLSS